MLPEFYELNLYWNSTLKDNCSITSFRPDAGDLVIDPKDYLFIRVEGYIIPDISSIFTSGNEATVTFWKSWIEQELSAETIEPLVLAKFDDGHTVTTTKSHFDENYSDKAEVVATLGCIFKTEQKGTKPLYLYKKEDRNDYFTMGTETGRDKAKASDYEEVVKLGYVIDHDPRVSIDLLEGDSPAFLRRLAGHGPIDVELDGDDASLFAITNGFHCQAVGAYRQYVYVGISNGDYINDPEDEKSTGILWINNGDERKRFDLPAGFPHPSNIQIINDKMVVAVEARYGTLEGEFNAPRFKKSMVLIYSLKDPWNPELIKKFPSGYANCGGAGLAFHTQKDCWFMLRDIDEGDDDKNRLALYKSPNSNRNFDFEWEEVQSYDSMGSGGGNNLFVATDGSIWGCFFDTGESIDDGLKGYEMTTDMVTLFRVTDKDGNAVDSLKDNAVRQVVTVHAPQVSVTEAATMINSRPTMRFGSGLRREGNKLEVIVCQRNMESDFLISRARIPKQDEGTVRLVNAHTSYSSEVYITSSSGGDAHLKESAFNTGGVYPSSEERGQSAPLTLKVKCPPELGDFSTSWQTIMEETSDAPINVFIFDEGELHRRIFNPSSSGDSEYKSYDH